MAKQLLKRRIPITTIHDEELGVILMKLGLYEKVMKDNPKCYFCRKSLTLENIGGLIQIEGEVRLICTDPKCLMKAAKISWERFHASV